MPLARRGMTERDEEAEASNWNVLLIMGGLGRWVGGWGGQKYFNLQPSEGGGRRRN